MWLLRLAITALSSSTFSHVAAYALSVSHPQIGRDALPNNASDVPDLSQLNANFTSLNDTQFHCSGEEYGSDLSFRSCLDALDYGLGHDTHPLSFGHRDSPGSFDVRLPARVSSGTASSPFPLINSHFHCYYFPFTVSATWMRTDEKPKRMVALPTPSRLRKFSSTSGLCRRLTMPAQRWRRNASVEAPTRGQKVAWSPV